MKFYMPALLPLVHADMSMYGEGLSTTREQQQLSQQQQEPEQQTSAASNGLSANSSDVAVQAIPPLYNTILAMHNRYRARHGAPPLQWDAGLARASSQWARACVFQHPTSPP